MSGIPDVRVDGVLQQLGSVGTDPENYANMLSLMNQRLAVPTDVTLELYASPVVGSTYMISAIVGIDTGGVGKTMNLYLAQALANYPYDPAQPYPQYNNGIMQGFEPIQITLGPGQTGTIFQEITFDPISWDPAYREDIRIIGFLQEPLPSGPAEVYQSEIIPYPFPQLIQCPADLNGDEIVDTLDLLDLLADWGCTGACLADINGDGIVDVVDLLELLGAWGPCPTEPIGACCMWDGSCADMTFYDCMMTGPAEWHEGEECATFNCPPWPTGACCISTDCVGTYTEYECAMVDGVWYEGEDCSVYECQLIYCDATSEYCDDEYISHVLFGAIDNPSDCGYYQDFTYLVNPITPGASQNITITNAEYWSTDLTTVWIDWNQDGDFDDADEEFAFGDPGGPITNGVITAPGGALLGETRMRIRIQYGGTPDPCGSMYYGEVEDYTVNVVE